MDKGGHGPIQRALHRKVRAGRLNDNGTFAKIYREHKARLLLGKKRKRGCTTRQEPVAVSNDLEELGGTMGSCCSYYRRNC
jgi:hypothetical protein